MNASTLRHWDIFCRVIDNFGDIGVSWRLARQLVTEHGITVRLWVDHLSSLAALCPGVDANAVQQTVQGVTVIAWHENSVFPQPAAVVIEAFGCGLPPTYLSALANLSERGVSPLWLVLEYLSAEPWVRGHHGLPSPHPRLDLQRYFFFPGFTVGTGGVLREADLLRCRDAFDAAARERWWYRQGFEAVAREALTVSVFAYPHAPMAALIDACAHGNRPVVMAIPDGGLALQVREYLSCESADRTDMGNLEVRFVRFVPQQEYDALLWACDVNFVRGEDSFVRAQWAGRPLVWHIYPQADDAHYVKLDAFLALFDDALAPSAAAAVRGLWHAWNGVSHAPPLADAWRRFVDELPAQRRGLGGWQARLEDVGDLAGNLVKFAEKLI